jgi:hypothetical protein
MKPETPEERPARMEEKSEAAFRKYRAVCYRCLTGELETNLELDAAEEEMEAAIIEAGNAYRALRKDG